MPRAPRCSTFMRLRQAFPQADGGELLVLDGVDLQLARGRDRRPARPLRVGQVDAAAHRSPA